MPTPKLTGRRRLEIIAEPAFIDAVAAAADKQHLSVSAYVRLAIMYRMESMDSRYVGEPVKPRGRRKAAAR